ncbi:aquaporin-like protein [Hymenopellis radicata]|nr:aquaporin-like protein [Hymenopellis radicata]
MLAVEPLTRRAAGAFLWTVDGNEPGDVSIQGDPYKLAKAWNMKSLTSRYGSDETSFPWRKVPGYILAQLLGGIVGAGIIYANYVHAIDIVEGGRNIRTLATAGNFGTFSLDYMTNVSCFFTEFLGTAILVLVILAVTDARNSPVQSDLLPLVLFILFLGIAASLGMQTGFALNPARDLGPRILTSLVGYGTDVYTFRNHYWIWCPIMASILGAQIATLLYDTILLKGEQSGINKPDEQTRRRMEIEKVV